MTIRPWKARRLPSRMGVAAGALAVLAGACATTPHAATPPPPTPVVGHASPVLDLPRLSALRERLSTLGRATFEFWRAHGPDPVNGGFHGTIDRQGRSIAPTDKGLIQTARHLWAMSMWYERKQPTPEVKALADGLYGFLMAHLRDGASDEFRFTVTEAGAPVENRKVLAGQALTIYALTRYAHAFNSAAAGAQALATFRAIDRRAHDAAHGGYLQINDASWLAPGADKETTTQVHLLEAFTALYADGHDPVVGARLDEMATICADRLLQPGGYLHKDFRADWSPLGPPAVSYGHDMETGWLLLEAARALGRADDPKLVAAARTMILSSATAGYDAVKGGYFEEGPPGGAPAKLEKVWWAQAEAMLALWRAFQLTGDPMWLDRLERTLTFIETSLRDATNGEWYWSVLPSGALGENGDVKGNAWKASYHTLRSLTFTEAWIGEEIARAPRSP